LGLVGLVIGGIGLILGLVGLIVALAGKTESVAMPISGTALSLVACLVSVVWWYITVHNFFSNVREGVSEFGKKWQEQVKEMEQRAEEERKERERKAKEEEAKEAREKANPLIVSAKELLDAYETNPVAADNKYKGKWLEVAGEVDAIDKVVKIDVTLKDQGRTKPRGLKCEFEDNQQATVAQLKPGDKVTIKGKCLGKFTTVGLEKCEVVKK
jgi:Sec-independent protein translocase protein TatA